MRYTPFATLFYVVRRLLQAVPLVIGVITINFTLIHMAPGDPAMLLAGEFADASAIQQLRTEFGLDKPLYVQYVTYLSEVATGNLGYSYRFREPVLDIVLQRLPNTLLLLSVSFGLSVVAGVVLAVFSARRPNSPFDNTMTALSLVGYCLPLFWLGMMLILVFSSMLGWFPTGGLYSLRGAATGFGLVADVAHHLVLPAIAYAAYFVAITYRLTRTKLVETLREDYIRTAHMKGLSETRVLFRHALPNSIVPVIAVLGLDLGVMIGGAVVVETVFSWPGVGRLMYDSILARDYPLLLGIFVVVSVGVIVVNLAADLFAAVVDPRIVYD